MFSAKNFWTPAYEERNQNGALMTTTIELKIEYMDLYREIIFFIGVDTE